MANLYFNGANNAFIKANSGTPWEGGSETDPIRPSYHSKLDVVPGVEMLKLGDGYAQFSLPNGLRRGEQKYALVFRNVTQAVQEALLKFFDGTSSAPYNREPNEFFYWTPPAGFGIAVAEYKWIIVDPFSSTPESYDAFTVNVVFTKVED